MSLFIEPELLTVKVDLGHAVTYSPPAMCLGSSPLITAPAGSVLGRDALRRGCLPPLFLHATHPVQNQGTLASSRHSLVSILVSIL